MTIRRGTRQKPGRHQRITSFANPQIKHVRALHQKKHRDRQGAFLAEGQQLVRFGLDAGFPIQSLVFDGAAAEAEILDIAARCKAGGAAILDVPKAVLAKISRRDNPQTAIGVFSQFWRERSEAGKTGVWVALEEIRDPGNLGTIIRTADAAGAGGVALIGDCCDPYSPEAVRASMGSIFHMPPARLSATDLLKQASDLDIPMIGTHLAAGMDFRAAAYGDPCVLVMGNEQKGLSTTLADACRQLVRIPMVGKAESLNLAVSAGLMLYEARRKAL